MVRGEVSAEDVRAEVNSISDFLKTGMNVKDHLETLNEHLNIEMRDVGDFYQNELMPVLQDFENNPESDREKSKVASLISDEESLKEEIRKVTSEFDDEFQELKEFVNKAERAKTALNRLEEIEEDLAS